MKTKSTLILPSFVPKVSAPLFMICALMLGLWTLASSAVAQPAFPDRSLVKGSADDVYIIAHGKACHLQNPAIFNGMGLNWNAISTISDNTLNSIPKSPLLLRGNGAEAHKVYIIEGGMRKWITNPEVFNSMGLDWNAILTITDAQLSSIPEGNPIENNTKSQTVTKDSRNQTNNNQTRKTKIPVEQLGNTTPQKVISERINEPTKVPTNLSLAVANVTGSKVQLYHYHLDSRKTDRYELTNNQQITLTVTPFEKLIAHNMSGSAISNYECTDQPNQTYAMYAAKNIRVEFNNQTGGYVDVISTNLDGSIRKITLKPQDFAISTNYTVSQILRFEQNQNEIKTYTVPDQDNQQIMIRNPELEQKQNKVGKLTSLSNADVHINDHLLQIPGTNQKLTVDELISSLAPAGITLVNSKELQVNQGTIIYANANENDLSAEFGLLVYATQVGDNVNLEMAVVHGGCDASDPRNQGLGVKCEVGVISQDLKVNFKGVQTNFNIKGPTAGGCASLSTEMLCANAGATLASTSFTVTDENGTGIGISLDAGVGYGLDGGYEEGILYGSINLKYIAGGSISFSLNVDDVRKKVMKVAETGYILSEREVIAASNNIANIYSNQLSPNIRNTYNKVITVVHQAGPDLVYTFDGGFKDIRKNITPYLNQTANDINKTVNDISNWFNVLAKGKKPRKLNPGEGYLSVYSNAGYVTNVSASFTYSGQSISHSEEITLGFTAEFYFPQGATNINLKAKGIGTTDKLKMNLNFPSVEGIRKCYKCWGSFFDVEWGEISCN